MSWDASSKPLRRGTVNTSALFAPAIHSLDSVVVAREVLRATRENGQTGRFLLDVFREGDHWTSTLARLDERGEPENVRVAPRFYGLTEEQARRRMIAALEHDWDDVQPDV